ncbi:VUT family protein [Candidatus Erwinia dacicola]|uniref:VUT family protein n=1 Tax=Candidatus Erwinia dacicola TaxID=252393 RepID=UPI0014321A88
MGQFYIGSDSILDLLNEFYGFRRTRNAIFLYIIGNAVILGLLTLSLNLPLLHGWTFDKGYSELIKQIQTTFLASTISFTISELVNSKVLCYLKRITNSKYLYIRIVSSIFLLPY